MTSRTPRTPPTEAVRVSEVLAALSFALDLTEGEPMGHSLRTCLIGMELADRLSLSLQDRRDLYYASAIGTEPRFADIIIEQAAAFDAAGA